MTNKVAVLLRMPDKITLHYGDEKVVVGTWADFSENVFYVAEDDFERIERFLAPQEDIRRLDS